MNSSKIKIRKTRLLDLKEIRRFLKIFDTGVYKLFFSKNHLKFSTFFLKMINMYLPLKWKLMSESYIALENNKIKALVDIIPDSNSHLRWRISQLLVEPNSYNTAKLLLDYIINKHGAEGVEAFITEVDLLNVDALDLFKNACGFRDCTKAYIYQFYLSNDDLDPTNVKGLREINSSDYTKLTELFSECLSPLVKTSMSKSEDDFKLNFHRYLFDKLNNVGIFKRWILEDPDLKSALAFAQVCTNDYKTFQISLYTSLPYAEYYYDILQYLFSYIKVKNPNAVIFISVSEGIQSYKMLITALEKLNAKLIQSCNILVKDYWRPLKETKILDSPIMIFPVDISPACNTIKVTHSQRNSCGIT